MATIVIDSGHGASDWGATRDGRMEKADNLALSIALGRELSRRGHRVIYTKETDIFLSLQERARISNANPTDLFVSVHRNAAENAAANGFEVWTANNASARSVACANSVLNAVNGLGVFANRGVRSANFTVLTATNAPAILVEYGFISNDQDNVRLDQNFSRIVNATADGIEACLGAGGGIVPPPITPPPSGQGLQGIITTAGGVLNVRSAPNTGAGIIGTVPNGTRVTILGEQNGWYQINLDGRNGWVSGNFVRFVPTTGTVATAGGNLNMRSAPNATASIITTIPNGTRLDITDIAGNFFQVNFGGRTGFVSRDFVRVG